MKYLNDGNIDYSVDDLVSIMINGKSISGLYSSCPEVKEFQKNMKILEGENCDFSLKKIDHKARQNTWFIPEEFLKLNIREFVFQQVSTKIEMERIEYELKIFEERNLLNLLRYFVFMVHIMRENNIVWGVGRGSAVSSYVLYIIGIHKINSIKYELDFDDFLN